ncbi:hypothetical protein SH584_04100 [Sphingomonas sp. LY29]|uniref:hypothetical protein n=1 Tax=Sphingomonas sp. LY29 TaxID=3095341 RepID=UPI002D79D295|nr:hypothetical protein [Sphingomonas sp. LY29]WRP26624.1 hypothetical protein SH584_04100 [Sphingomonas sp. LY29]
MPQSDTAPAVGSELLDDAKGVGTSAVNRLHSEVDARKSDAATQVKSVSSAIEKARDGLDTNAPAWLKSAFDQGAQQVQRFADTLEQKDSRQLVNEVSDFARGSPGTFLAACAAAGFAAARIFKAGGSENSPSQLGPVGTDFHAANQSPESGVGEPRMSTGATTSGGLA